MTARNPVTFAAANVTVNTGGAFGPGSTLELGDAHIRIDITDDQGATLIGAEGANVVIGGALTRDAMLFLRRAS